MRTRVSFSSSFAVVGLCAILASPLSAQDKTDPSPVQVSASSERLTGLWRFNKELSTPLPDPDAAPDAGGGRRGPGGGGGGGGGGRGGGGRGRGGRGGAGGGGGAYGGGGGGGRSGAGGRGATGTTDDLMKARALARDLADVPAALTIIVAPTHVTITSDQGAVRKFTTDDTSQEIDLGTAKVLAKTKWDQEILTQEWTAGKAKFKETYQVTVQGHMLVIRVEPVAAGNAPAGRTSTPVAKYIFDKAE